MKVPLFYRALLLLYPAAFRREYHREMSGVFAQRYARASRVGRVMLLAEAIGDTLHNATAAHADALSQDVRYAFRALRRAPLFGMTVMVVAALGIGATTAAFSVADHVLLRPLQFPNAERLVKLWQDPGSRGSRLELSPITFRDYQGQLTSLAGMAAFNVYSANLLGHGDPIRLDGTRATGEFFDVLGIPPALGRSIRLDDDREGAPRTVLLSHRLWQTRFGGNAQVLGQTITLDDTPHVVVGVMPRTFDFPLRTVDFWVPFQLGPRDYEDRSNVYLNVVARLKDGVSVEEARAEAKVFAQQLERQYPQTNTKIGANVLRLRDEISQQARLLLIGLVAASVALLLIAATNLANLLLTRALSRQREMAVRSAMGAGRERLVRQMLTETVLLAGIGGLVGVAIAAAVVPSVARLVPTTLPIAETPGLDWRMLTVAIISTLTTAALFGVVPALRAGRHADAAALREGARAGSGRRTERLRSTLVVAEVTMSVVLLVSAGLLVRALWKVQEVDPGFKADGVLTARTALPLPKYTETALRHQFYDRVLADVRALPGVTNAGYISFLPMVMRGGIWSARVDGKPDDPGARRSVSLRQVTPGVFGALGVPVVHGRDVSDADTPKSLPVALVSESFVREHWSESQDPLGRRITIGASRDFTVVGVVGDIRVRGLERASEPQVYIASRQVPDNNIIFYLPKDLVIRSSTEPSTLVTAVRDAVKRADPMQPVSDIQPLNDIVLADTAPRRVQVRVLGAFAVIAFVLAAIGIHGVLAFNVSARARDIGVRLALGAERQSILRMVLGHGFTLAGIGAVLGAGLSLAAGRSMQALLAGLSPTDTVTLVAAVGLTLAMTTLGSLFPALRAMRVDPIQVIRTE